MFITRVLQIAFPRKRTTSHGVVVNKKPTGGDFWAKNKLYLGESK